MSNYIISYIPCVISGVISGIFCGLSTFTLDHVIVSPFWIHYTIISQVFFYTLIPFKVNNNKDKEVRKNISYKLKQYLK